MDSFAVKELIAHRSFKDILKSFLLLQVKRFQVKRFPRKLLVTRKLYYAPNCMPLSMSLSSSCIPGEVGG